MRPSQRAVDELRTISFERQYTKHAEGSVLVSFGDTKVLCTASLTDGVPKFLKGQHKGWVTAEYGMLPRATGQRTNREAARGKQTGRTQEIQRLIGRSLRTALDLTKLGDYTIHLDCDVLQADGGTRTASITGAAVALCDCIAHMQQKKLLKENPLRFLIASVSVGVFNGKAVLDLDYAEDSSADTDMNVVMNEHGEFVEIQGTAEGQLFSDALLNDMLGLAKGGIHQLVEAQRQALGAAQTAKAL